MRRRPFIGARARPMMRMGMRRHLGPRFRPGHIPMRLRPRWFPLGMYTILAFSATGAMYKLHLDDIQRIENYSGTSVRAMPEEDLQQAMKKLEITGTEFTEEDRKAAGWQQPSGWRQPDTKLTSEDLDLLERVTQMYYSGQLSEEEYQAKRRQILGL